MSIINGRPCEEIYVVGEGETLHTISDKCGDPFILEENPHIQDPDDVFPGLDSRRRPKPSFDLNRMTQLRTLVSIHLLAPLLPLDPSLNVVSLAGILLVIPSPRDLTHHSGLHLRVRVPVLGQRRASGHRQHGDVLLPAGPWLPGRLAGLQPRMPSGPS
ncbi:hypothetical protein J5N97_020643 [Dioscorea zingiberensis]|uniref:LysM domain-containing protein n=1 Tax=Dioscorea zingiberensis TaxID=325984 RepID=A0A9D5CGT7_9LILI|nr:hypothetical protein J5N97_020643 [Dioscorea zingiberensis]